MVGQLVVVSGPDQGRLFPLIDGKILTVGRGNDTSTQLRDPRCSRRHCHVIVDNGRFTLKDEGSAGGTFVNNKQVQTADLQPGDVIRLGDTELRFQLAGAAEDTTMVGGMPAAPKPPTGAPSPESLIGQMLSSYRVDKIIARGQTGTVFLAQDTKNNFPVALKVLGEDFSHDEAQVQRFVRAMKTMLPIRHPNLVALYGAGKSGPHCYIAMEYIPGEDLTKVIERIGTAGMLDWTYAYRVAVHVGRALQVAHQHQIIHRNITPTNIMIRSEDKLVKLGDLMLAKALEGTQAYQVTRPGQLIGDIAFMSPERTRGEEAVDLRSDIYGLGATVYALLTGRPPFKGESIPETIAKIRNEQPERPKKFQLSIPDLFEGAVLKMIAKRPEDRYHTPGELVAELERVGLFQGVTV